MLLPHPLSKIKITKHFKQEHKFNAVNSGDNLLRMNDGPISWIFDGKQSKEKNRVLLFIDKNTAVYFDSFEIEYIPEKVINKIKYKSITQSIFRIQDDDSFMSGFFLHCSHWRRDCRKNVVDL